MAYWDDDGDAALWDGHDGQSFVLASWFQHGVGELLERLETRVTGRGVCRNVAVNTGSVGDNADYSFSISVLG